MGLSSSQARLLNLTSRMHQIEYKAAKLEAEKLRMANKSKRVYQEYQNALEQTKLQVSYIQSDGSIDYMDATYNNLVERGYQLKFDGEDKVLITPKQKEHYLAAIEEGGREYFAALEARGYPPDNGYDVNGVKEVFTSSQFANALADEASVRLMTDIDMSINSGYTSKNVQNLVLDGNGHSITGLKTALFDRVTGNSSISNLSLSGNDVNARGVLANTVNTSGTISNISVTGDINYTAQDSGVGGLIGTLYNGTVSYCAVNLNIVSTKGTIGGFIGSFYGGNINNCTTSGSIKTQGTSAGGFIGWVPTTNVNRLIDNCIARCDVTSDAISSDRLGYETRAGGFIGLLYSNDPNNTSGYYNNGTTVTIKNCSATGAVSAAGGYSGGFIGHANDSSNATIDHCSSSGKVTYNTGDPAIIEYWANEAQNGSGACLHYNGQSGGFIGSNKDAKIQNCNCTSDLINAYQGTASLEEGHIGAFATYDTQGNPPKYSNNYVSNNISTTSPQSIASGGTSNNISVSPQPPSITTTQTVANDSAKALWDEIQEKGYTLVKEDDPRIEHGDDNRWLTNMVNEGYLFIYKKDTKTNEYYQVSVSTDTNLQEVDDDKELRKAEAKYEADMRQIDMKDRKFDYDLAALDAERNAIKSEMETLKTVAKDNVDRTFKLFG